MGKTTNIVEARKTDVAVADIANLDTETRALIEAGGGIEDLVGRDVVAIPFLTILQPLSPQVNPTHGRYVEGAKVGHIFDTATEEYFISVQVIPVVFQRSFLEWVPRDNGGGFRGEHAGIEAIEEFNKLLDRKTGKALLENGNHLVDTRSYFVLRVREDGSATPAMISMASTQTKKSKSWNKMILDYKPDTVQVETTNGELKVIQTPMSERWMYKGVYNLDTVMEENKKGKFFGWRIRRIAQTPGRLFTSASRFYQQIKGGAVTVDRGDAEEEHQDDTVM